MRRDLAEGRLWRLPPGEGVCSVDLHLLWHRDVQRSPAEATFLKHFRDYIDGFTMAERLVPGNLPPP